jgi:hypothetical protein
MAADAPLDDLFQLEVLKEEEFDQKLDLAEDILSQLASSRNNNAAVWMNDFKVFIV